MRGFIGTVGFIVQRININDKLTYTPREERGDTFSS